MIKKSGPLFACVALIAGVGFAQAQPKTEEIEAARAQACVPPPCEKPTDYPPCEKPEVQHRLPGAELISIAVADGGEVRPLGGAAPARPELSVCARLGDDSFQLYLPSIDEPILRLGMLAVLNSAMQARAPVDITYGLPNGALRKIEGVGFGAPVGSDVVQVTCGYGDFDRCDTSFEAKADGAKARDSGRITRINLIGYGKGSRAVQIFTDIKTQPSFLIDPGAAPERFLQLMNFALTAQIAGIAVEIVSSPGQAPAEAKDKSLAPPIAFDITSATTR